MIPYIRVLWKILFYFQNYKPQPVTILSVRNWLNQFPPSIRRHLYLLLDQVIYFSEKKTIENLSILNNTILNRLKNDNIGIDKIVYIATDTAGSSSHIMLGLLRDAENLERKGAKLISSGDAFKIKDLTSKLGKGGIIYVDDFAGTGKQFRKNRNWAAQFIVGAFSEFFLAPVICEEARVLIEELGVVPVTNINHLINQRPLHRNATILKDDCKNEILKLCEDIHPKAGLGFENLATMIVFYRNAPNSMPLVFRGSLKQSPFKGIFPRTDDLPY